MIVKFYSDSLFKVEYIVSETMIHFNAFKIEAMDEEKIELSEVSGNTDVSGFIKWDGCMEFTQNTHWCGLYMLEQFALLIKQIYQFNGENDREAS